MPLTQRTLTVILLPLLSLILYQSYSDTPLHASIQTALEPYLPYLPFSTFHRSEAETSPSSTPLIISATPEWSHVEKIASVALSLARLGYPITFIAVRKFEQQISALHENIKFAAMRGPDDKLDAEQQALFETLPASERETYLMKIVLMDRMADVHHTLQSHFTSFREEFGSSKPLISLFDCTLTGHHPVLLGAPGIRPDASVGINLHPLTLDSNDTFPFSMGKAPHEGVDRLDVHRKAYEEVERASVGVYDYWWGKLRELGAEREEFPALLQGMNLLPEYLFTLGVPEFEFPRSDLRANVRWFGGFKEVGSRSGGAELPGWWSDVAKAKKEGKKIVLISQGTLEAEFGELTLPTLDVLKDRDDLLVVATFAVKEPEEVLGLVVPENARVARFVPFDVLLPLVDVLVSNGGYGAVQHCMRVGVPLVVAGEGQDKAVTNAIVEFKGVGVNLGTQRPKPDDIEAAVDRVLKDETFRKKAQRMSEVYAKYDVGEVFNEFIKDVVRGFQQGKRKAA